MSQTEEERIGSRIGRLEVIRASILVKLSSSPGSNPPARNLIQLQQMSFPCSDCQMGVFSRVPELFSIYWNILEILVHVKKGRYSLRYEILDISNDAPSYSIWTAPAGTYDYFSLEHLGLLFCPKNWTTANPADHTFSESWIHPSPTDQPTNHLIPPLPIWSKRTI